MLCTKIDAKDKRNMGRQYGIDVINLGGIMDCAHSTNYAIAELLKVATFCAVNCYALISGYVGIGAKYRIANIIYLWCQVIFYTVTITILVNLFFPQAIGIKDYLKAFTPVLTEQYWYFTAYFVMFFFIPFMNRLINTLTVREMKLLMITIVAIFSILQTIRNYSVFYTNGFDCFWLAFLYLIGACIKKSGLDAKIRKKNAAITYFISVFITLGGGTGFRNNSCQDISISIYRRNIDSVHVADNFGRGNLSTDFFLSNKDKE